MARGGAFFRVTTTTRSKISIFCLLYKYGGDIVPFLVTRDKSV